MVSTFKYSCVVIDDEPHSIEAVRKYIEQIPSLHLVKYYQDPLEALIALSDGEQVDLILLDIDMPKITGIELSKQIREKTRKLVFTTAHTKYGYEAFEVSADAYLLKPYSLAKFVMTIEKLLPSHGSAPIKQQDDYLFVKNKNENHKLVRVNYRDIIAVESKQNYIMIYTPGQNLLAYMSLTEISQMLSLFPYFVKYHRSFIINKDHIASIYGNTLCMSNGLQVTVGDNFRKDFMDYLERKLLKAGRKI